MRNHLWLKYIQEAQNAYTLREIFNKTYGLVGNPEIAKQFFDRIDFLISRNPLGTSTRNLEDLKEDIEDEIENKTRNTKQRAEYTLKINEADSLKAIANKSIKKEVCIDGEIIADIDFERGRNLIYKAEKELIYKTLIAFDQNRTKAADALGVTIRTLRNKLNEYKHGESFAGYGADQARKARKQRDAIAKVAQNSEVA